MSRRESSIIKIFLIIALFASLLAIWRLVSIPSDVKNEVLFGFSPVRLGILGSGLVLSLGLTGLFGWVSASEGNLQRAIRFVDVLLSNPKNRTFISFIGGLAFVCAAMFFLTPADRIGVDIYRRLSPLAMWVMLVAAGVLIGQFLWLRGKIYWPRLLRIQKPLGYSAALMLIFLLLWLGIAWSGIGIDREKSGWLSPGTPLLAQQVAFAWGVSLVFLLAKWKINQNRRLDLLIGSLLWAAGGIIWWAEPMLRESYFTSAPTPPNFEFYPYSDAGIYDLFSQNVLIGFSRQAGLTNRPLYSLFLALMHVLGGQKYETVTSWQLWILALIPVAAYFLVSKLAGRPAGLLAAILLIFRERNSIALTNIIEVSHAKLLMSDVPTMLLMILFVYLFVTWLRDHKDQHGFGLLAGAGLGFGILIRSQILLLVPVALLGILLINKSKGRILFQRGLALLAGILIIVAPWVYRNHQLSGRITVEYQAFYARFIASSYSVSESDYDRLPLETDQQYDDRMKRQILDYILADPLGVARFQTSYFLHNEIASLTYLPMTLQFHDLYDYVRTIGFWDAPYLGRPPANTWPALFVLLGIMAVGIGTSFYRHGWLGLMPILFHLGYSYSVAVVKQSGWRFILPVDWISVIYFSVGLMEISRMAVLLFSENEPVQLPGIVEDERKPSNGRGRIIPMLIVLSIAGLSLPFIEWRIPRRYAELTGQELVQLHVKEGMTLQGEGFIPAAALRSFLEAEPDAVVLHGRALYPQYYGAGEYWGDDDSYPLPVRSIDRLQFTLIGPQAGLVFLPAVNAPDYFPNASDVVVVGCQTQEGIRALAVNVNRQPSFVVADPWPGLACSLGK